MASGSGEGSSGVQGSGVLSSERFGGEPGSSTVRVWTWPVSFPVKK